ncbi:hypothetical protein H6785_01840 [Candidatus Nomurabacteria bacterium]|nr:hypothetical protein [Candidatus Kaiserbacteria bacterium]MCB9815298.1 hypothetical protein [Candidatus Nomurabacteria bacterium]
MKKILATIPVSSVLLLPFVSSAQIADSSNGGGFEDLLINLMQFINDVLIPFIIGIGFLFFVWGMFLYFIMGGADDEKKVKGRSLMIHAVIGFVVIIIFFGVINLLTSSTGLEGESIQNIPSVIVP